MLKKQTRTFVGDKCFKVTKLQVIQISVNNLDTCIFTRSPNGCFKRQTYTSQTDKKIPSNKMILNDRNVDEHYIYLFMEKKQAQKFTHNMILSRYDLKMDFQENGSH